MKRIVLISCVSKKKNTKSKAKDLYISPLFTKNLKYAKSLNPDHIYILSAKYGLVALDQEIDPYNKTLNEMKATEIAEWANSVLNQLQKVTDLQNDNFIFLAGEKYRKFLLEFINNFEVPLKGLSIGKQLQWLSNKISEENNCEQIHQLLNIGDKYSFPFEEEKIPKNGIYILFERNEQAHSRQRIVRIGSHTGKDQLASRLKEHFINENKDRSIFRKHIGRAILKKNNDDFLKIWDIDLTTREAKKLYSAKVDYEKLRMVEKQVTDYIQDNFKFVTLEIEDKEERLYLEKRLISTISLCNECGASKKWLGMFSPNNRIRESGLWNVNELWKTPLTDQETRKLKEIIRNTKQPSS